MKALLLLGSPGLSARYPLTLFALRLAAQLSSAMLLGFGLFLTALMPGWPVILFTLLLLAFGFLNLAALYRIKTSSEPADACLLRVFAQICNVLLPAAYCIGVVNSGLVGGFALSKLMAVAIPAALNGLAIEKSWQFHFPAQSATEH